MTLKTKNPLLLLILVSVLILAAVAVTYRSTTVLVEKTITAHQQGIADEAAKMTEIWLGQQTRILKATAASVSLLPKTDTPGILRFLEMAMKAGHFSDVYIGTPGGVLIDGAGWHPPSSYDPRQRPWYRRAMEAGRTVSTVPYQDLVTNEPVIALVSPLIVDHDFRGVIGADTVLDTLVENLRAVKVGETGFAFIVNGNGTILVHPNSDYPMKVKLQDTDPSLRHVLDDFARSPSGTVSYRHGERAEILSYTKIADSNWTLCTTIPRDEAYRIARKTTVLFAAEIVLKVLGGIALVTLLFAFGNGLAFFVFSRRYTTTLQKQQDEITGINEDLAWNIHKRKELEKHYQTLFNVANDVILVSKDLCLECNEKATEVFGLSRLGIIGRSLLDLSPEFQPDGEASAPRAWRIVEEAIAGKHQVFEWTFLRPNGSEFPAEVSLKSLKLDNDQLCLSSIRDISKRVNAEQQLRQAQKMSAMGEMLGAIAHQWRQPLNTLSTYIASLQSAYLNERISKSFVETLVAGSDAQIQFMSKTIDDFRHFFRPSKNKETFDVAKAVQSAAKLLEPTLKQGNIALEMKVDEVRKFVVYGYPSEFVHVVVNVLANARDAIGERLAAEPPGRKGRIEIGVDSDREAVVVRVRDNGGGIPSHLIEKIFTPYFTTKGTTTGTGIGLYMAKMIVEKEMKGKLLVDNIEEGAQLTIRLPKTAKAG
jgi:PAS domain S-box-containing protein